MPQALRRRAAGIPKILRHASAAVKARKPGVPHGVDHTPGWHAISYDVCDRGIQWQVTEPARGVVVGVGGKLGFGGEDVRVDGILDAAKPRSICAKPPGIPRPIAIMHNVSEMAR